MGRMRLPSLSLHGIEGAFAGPGAKTVIPAKVGGKFSIRCVIIVVIVVILACAQREGRCDGNECRWMRRRRVQGGRRKA